MGEQGPRRHLTVHLGGDAARAIDELRAVWDPVMRGVAPAHVTVVYPEETVDAELLLERAAHAADGTAAFDIRLGAFGCEDEGCGGVFVMVEDLAGGLETLRDRLLLPPQRFSGYPFHATVAHPRTSPSPSACWTQLRGRGMDLSFTVRELLWTITDASTHTVLERFALTGRPEATRVALAGAMVMDHGRVLLGLRQPDRASFPSVWDLPGGHVEPRESPRQALRRELREELGIEATLAEPWRRLVDDDLQIELSLWLIRRWRGELSNRAPHEHQRLRWLTANDLGSLPLAHPIYLPLLRDALAT
ncbi:NUDIX domain-containing protein [Brachybacterium hainanense]|uniref:8-oxo-dGTP diphosphatase n=1 Tax=Brachybacterium hainanense TaxID=1541174 RepID=A0ABV6RA03_9MICO